MKTSDQIAQEFGLMCAFIEFSPEIPPEERGDILYKEFVKRTGSTLTKEELAEILKAEMSREYVWEGLGYKVPFQKPIQNLKEAVNK